GQTLTSVLFIQGQPASEPPEVEFRAATPAFFTAMGIPLLEGRLFNELDSPNQYLMIIDEVTAKRYFPGQSAVGKRIRFNADPNGPWYEIVGIVGAIRHYGIEVEPRATIYRPAIVNPLSSPVFVIRTATSPQSMVQTLSTALKGANPGM